MSLVGNKIRRMKELRNVSGIQNLLNEAYLILGNPIYMHDLDYVSIAYTENKSTDDPIWNELSTIGSLSMETIELLKNESFLDAAANAKTICLLTSENLKHDRLFGKVYNKDNINVADTVLSACYKPFDDDDPLLFEILCDLLTKEISKSMFYQIYGNKYRESFIEKLINGNIDDKKLYPIYVEIIYEGLKTNLFLAVADASQCGSEHTELAYFKELLKLAQPVFKYAIYSDYIVIIISSDNEAISIKRDLKKLNSLFKQNNIYAGVSSRFENLFELKKYYTEAVSALNRGKKSSNGQHFFLNDEI